MSLSQANANTTAYGQFQCIAPLSCTKPIFYTLTKQGNNLLSIFMPALIALSSPPRASTGYLVFRLKPDTRTCYFFNSLTWT